jgi:hypothetical protein
LLEKWKCQKNEREKKQTNNNNNNRFHSYNTIK